MRFILIHKGYSEDLIKSFFNEVYEIYVKILLNLFLDKYTKILPSNYIKISFSKDEENDSIRYLNFRAYGDRLENVLKELEA